MVISPGKGLKSAIFLHKCGIKIFSFSASFFFSKNLGSLYNDLIRDVAIDLEIDLTIVSFVLILLSLIFAIAKKLVNPKPSQEKSNRKEKKCHIY